MRHLACDRYDVFSAGVNPTTINPSAIRVMDDIGIDISKQRSKSIDEFRDEAFDYVITVCDNAKESCPYFAGSKMIHWNIDDPAAAKGSESEIIPAFIKSRDIIQKYILDFMDSD